MYCIKCGNKLNDNMKFCDQCGAPVPKRPKPNDDFKAPIIVNDPMDNVPDEFDNPPSKEEVVKKEIEREVEDSINEENVNASVEDKTSEKSHNLELHEDIIIQEEKKSEYQREENSQSNFNNQSRNDEYFYKSNRENPNYYTGRSQSKDIVNIIALVSMILMGLLGIRALFTFISSFFFIITGGML